MAGDRFVSVDVALSAQVQLGSMDPEQYYLLEDPSEARLECDTCPYELLFFKAHLSSQR